MGNYRVLILKNGLIEQWYHASFTSTAQQTWTFSIPFTDGNSFSIAPTVWANSDNIAPLQYHMLQKGSTGIKYMSLNGGEHNFIAIGY